jgi:hypothetical protein
MAKKSRKQYADKNWSWDEGHPSDPIKKFGIYAPKIAVHNHTVKIITIDAVIGGKATNIANPDEWYIRKFLHAEFYNSDIAQPLQTLAYLKKFARTHEIDLIQLTPKSVRMRGDLSLDDALLDHRITTDHEIEKFVEIYCNMCDKKDTEKNADDYAWLYAAMAKTIPLQHLK